jgi:integrase
MRGSVYKRCKCPVERNAKGERLACKIKHGSWFYVADGGVNLATGKRRQLKRGGFPTKAAAEQALAELVDQTAKGMTAHDGRQTVGQFLESWLAEKERNGLRPTTVKSYRQHLDQYLVPGLGRLRLQELRPGHVEQMLATVSKPATKGKRAVGATSVRRVHATLRSALSTAKRRRLISYNPAVDVELPAVSRPKVRPWEAADLGAFLDAVARDPLSAAFETIAATGTRRGEALGLRWSDVDLARGRAVIRQQLLQLDGDQPPCAYCGERHKGCVFGPVKTSSGENRVIDLDAGVIGVLMEHRLRQDAEREAWGSAYSDHGLVFAREDGTPMKPETVTKRFKALQAEHSLRAIRLHDLRHGRASLLLASGTDIALVSKLLGHSSISLTADTYSHLLEGVGREAAERASALVPRASNSRPAASEVDQVISASGHPERPDDKPEMTALGGQRSDAQQDPEHAADQRAPFRPKKSHGRDSRPVAADPCDQLVTNQAPETTRDLRPNDGDPEIIGADCAPRGNRTPNPLIKSQLLCQLS